MYRANPTSISQLDNQSSNDGEGNSKEEKPPLPELSYLPSLPIQNFYSVPENHHLS